MNKYYRNGVVVQKKSSDIYKGIEGDNWYFNALLDPENELVKNYSKYVEISEGIDEILDVCINNEYIKEYILSSKKMGIDARILLCETMCHLPQYNADNFKLKFLGYDYAYTGGDYYSVILNDVVSQRIEAFRGIQLNENGLFNLEEELDMFIKKREEFVRLDRKLLFERGGFEKYKLYEIDIDSFLINT